MTIRTRAAAVVLAGSGVFAGGVARAGDSDSFVGDALVRSDVHGRIVIVLDQVPPDGHPDRVFLFTPERPIEAGFRIVLRDALVTHERGILRVSSAISLDKVELMLSGEPSVQRSGRSYVITGGLGIVDVHGDFEDQVSGLDGVSTDDWIGVVTPDVFGAPVCPSGGTGSTHCGISCGGGVLGGHLTVSCDADCKEGSYACCSCVDGVLVPHCYCVADDGGIKPPIIKPATP